MPQKNLDVSPYLLRPLRSLHEAMKDRLALSGPELAEGRDGPRGLAPPSNEAGLRQPAVKSA